MKDEIKKHKMSLELDMTKYEKYLTDENITERQKNELLKTLWNLICEFVTLGFEVHPLNFAMQEKEALNNESDRMKKKHISKSEESNMLELGGKK